MTEDILYTREQIENDIWEFERVKARLGVPECIRFPIKYSEYFDEALTGDDTVNDLKKRISEFVDKYGYIPN